MNITRSLIVIVLSVGLVLFASIAASSYTSAGTERGERKATAICASSGVRC